MSKKALFYRRFVENYKFYKKNLKNFKKKFEKTVDKTFNVWYLIIAFSVREQITTCLNTYIIVTLVTSLCRTKNNDNCIF